MLRAAAPHLSLLIPLSKSTSSSALGHYQQHIIPR